MLVLVSPAFGEAIMIIDISWCFENPIMMRSWVLSLVHPSKRSSVRMTAPLAAFHFHGTQLKFAMSQASNESLPRRRLAEGAGRRKVC